MTAADEGAGRHGSGRRRANRARGGSHRGGLRRGGSGAGGRRTWLRVRALLAGGLVLGFGAAATVAAWNDSEFASGTVTASTFGIEGSVNGGTYAEHATSGEAATLAFSPALPALSPGDAGFMQFSVRTTAASTTGGTVGMQTPVVGGSSTLADALRYAVRVIPAGSACDAALFSNASAPVIVGNETALTAAVAANSRPLDAAAANEVSYCVRISMLTTAPTTVQGQTTTMTWQFLATSL
ncbi:SipW-dependent-type signal peptide-containing protein [Ruania halotolerans]|uniref:SipW-dependent-type signal peptide-containing protein n=1 Tax=Ruania halotolerans TaxID=2897773 RepID=UPI001E6382B4|nr:SipW-dependent-type signal peptide-containing protein [Ruania halotolerans]UFU06512.1 SipW-dependent-type signal peptide-containing protein [Ruania halotolerans]